MLNHENEHEKALKTLASFPVSNLALHVYSKFAFQGINIQTFQLLRILRETHTFDLFLTLTRIDTILSRKSEKNIESIHLFVLTYLFASESLYLAELVALKYVTCQ